MTLQSVGGCEGGGGGGGSLVPLCGSCDMVDGWLEWTLGLKLKITPPEPPAVSWISASVATQKNTVWRFGLETWKVF